MALKLKPGQRVTEYEIVREMSVGAFAIAYEARKGSQRIFLKQYKSPSPLVSWFKGFVDHQGELKRRIESSPASKERCYRFDRFFTEKSSFYQAFEFVDGGMSLEECLRRRHEFDWTKQLVVFAKIMVFGLKALHEIRIVHTDLKPENIILIQDPTLAGTGYRLRIIDMDWSIFADSAAPWHGEQGYVGTPGYQSPEHLKGQVPTSASDVFTCGIMLGEILGGGHPFARAGENYPEAVLAGRFSPIRIAHEIAKVADNAFLESVINACLDPDPAGRPSMAQLSDALIGKTFPWTGYVPSGIPEAGGAPSIPSAAPSASKRQKVEVWLGDRRLTVVGVDAWLGKANFKGVDPDVKYVGDRQFHLIARDGGWFIEHYPDAPNETVVDGQRLAEPLPVADGMRVAVGNTAKKIEKFPLLLKLVA